MDDKEIREIWKTYDNSIENAVSVNQKSIEELQKIKMKTVLSSSKPIKIFTIIVGILWVIFIDSLIIKAFSYEYLFFVVSAGLHSLISKIAIGTYIYHLILIDQIDNSKTIIEVQEKLANLKTSTLQITRLLFLQLPLFTTFQLNMSMFQNGHTGLWIFQIFVTSLFTYVSIWLFINIKRENINKKWLKFILREREWDSVIKAIYLLDQIDEYKVSKKGDDE